MESAADHRKKIVLTFLFTLLVSSTMLLIICTQARAAHHLSDNQQQTFLYDVKAPVNLGMGTGADVTIFRQTTNWVVPNGVTLTRDADVLKRDGKGNLIWPYKNPKLRNGLATLILGSSIAATWALVRNAAHQTIVPDSLKNGVRKMLSLPTTKRPPTPQEEAAKQELDATLSPAVTKRSDDLATATWHLVRRGFGPVQKVVFGAGMALAGATWYQNGLHTHFVNAFDSSKSFKKQKRCQAAEEEEDVCLTEGHPYEVVYVVDDGILDDDNYDDDSWQMSRDLSDLDEGDTGIHLQRRSQGGKHWPSVSMLNAQAFISQSREALYIRWRSGNVTAYLQASKGWTPVSDASRVPPIGGAQSGTVWEPITGKRSYVTVSADRSRVMVRQMGGDKIRFVRMDRTTPSESRIDPTANQLQQGSWSLPLGNSPNGAANTIANGINGPKTNGASGSPHGIPGWRMILFTLIIAAALVTPSSANVHGDGAEALQKRSPGLGHELVAGSGSPTGSALPAQVAFSHDRLPVYSSLRGSGPQFNHPGVWPGMPKADPDTQRRFAQIGENLSKGEEGMPKHHSSAHSSRGSHSRKLLRASADVPAPKSNVHPGSHYPIAPPAPSHRRRSSDEHGYSGILEKRSPGPSRDNAPNELVPPSEPLVTAEHMADHVSHHPYPHATAHGWGENYAAFVEKLGPHPPKMPELAPEVVERFDETQRRLQEEAGGSERPSRSHAGRSRSGTSSKTRSAPVEEQDRTGSSKLPAPHANINRGERHGGKNSPSPPPALTKRSPMPYNPNVPQECAHAHISPNVQTYLNHHLPHVTLPPGSSPSPAPGPSNRYDCYLSSIDARPPQLPHLPADVQEQFSNSQKRMEEEASRDSRYRGRKHKRSISDEGDTFVKRSTLADEVPNPVAIPYSLFTVLQAALNGCAAVILLSFVFLLVLFLGKRQIDLVLAEAEGEQQAIALDDKSDQSHTVQSPRKHRVLCYTVYILILGALAMGTTMAAVKSTSGKGLTVGSHNRYHVPEDVHAVSRRPISTAQHSHALLDGNLTDTFLDVTQIDVEALPQVAIYGFDDAEGGALDDFAAHKRLHPPTGITEKVLLGASGLLLAGAGALGITALHRSQAPVEKRNEKEDTSLPSTSPFSSALQRREPGILAYSALAAGGLLITHHILKKDSNKKTETMGYGVPIVPNADLARAA